MLVKIPSPTAIDFQTSYSEFWVHGDWKVTGKNGRGGLTITLGKIPTRASCVTAL